MPSTVVTAEPGPPRLRWLQVLDRGDRVVLWCWRSGQVWRRAVLRERPRPRQARVVRRTCWRLVCRRIDQHACRDAMQRAGLQEVEPDVVVPEPGTSTTIRYLQRQPDPAPADPAVPAWLRARRWRREPRDRRVPIIPRADRVDWLARLHPGDPVQYGTCSAPTIAHVQYRTRASIVTRDQRVPHAVRFWSLRGRSGPDRLARATAASIRRARRQDLEQQVQQWLRPGTVLSTLRTAQLLQILKILRDLTPVPPEESC